MEDLMIRDTKKETNTQTFLRKYSNMFKMEGNKKFYTHFVNHTDNHALNDPTTLVF